LLLVSAVLGGVAWGAASLQDSLGRAVGYAAVAICLPYGIGVLYFFAVACSTWN
jgi:hypothetical protein